MHQKNSYKVLTVTAALIVILGTFAQAQSPRLYATSRQLQTLLNRIETQTDTFKVEASRNLNNNNNSRNDNRDVRISDLISDFETATDTLRTRVSGRQTLSDEVDQVLRQGSRINGYVLRNRLTGRSATQWTAIRNDLNTLAGYYRISWNWNQQDLPANNNGAYNSNGNDNRNNGSYNGTGPVRGNGPGRTRIEGTYRLDASRSDNVTDVISRTLGTTNNSSSNSNGIGGRGLERRLASPEMIAIDAQGTSITLATSDAPQATFEANGTANRETNQRGRAITTIATYRNNELQINQTGDRVNDFNVTFAATGPDQLTVTKRLYLEGRNDTVTVRSVYQRTSERADWTAVNSNTNNNTGWNNNTNSGSNNSSTGNNGNSAGTTNDFYIPNGTRLAARLDTTVNTRASQVGDRISLTVTSPSQYNGAIIEGRLVEAASSGRVTGRANLSFSFDTVRMNGRTYNFAGIIDAVRAANGETVSVNNEGTVRDSNQTTKTATRAGIGAVLGAIVGAIAGGGSGAAIGAGVGAGAGAGTVLIGGRDSLELGPGSTFDITASAPANARVSSN